MLFAVRFVDITDQVETRKAYLDTHIQWLDKHKNTILVGGSLREKVEENPVGGLWIVEAESKAEVEALIKTDPFWINGLRESYQILHWSKAFKDRKTLV